MSGHTPGPWTFTPDPYGSLDDYMVGPLDGPADAVAVCSNKDARLIASAPDLLDAHEAEMADLELLAKAIHAGDPMPELVIRITDMLNRKRAAIAKATGA